MNELNRAQNSFHSAPVGPLVNAGELNSKNEDIVGLKSKADKPAEALGNNGVHQRVHQLESGALIGQLQSLGSLGSVAFVAFVASLGSVGSVGSPAVEGLS